MMSTDPGSGAAHFLLFQDWSMIAKDLCSYSI
jgi:hypothetical protein